MENPVVTIRLSPRIKTAVMRQARRDSLSFSDVVRILLKAYAKGDVKVKVEQKGVIGE